MKSTAGKRKAPHLTRGSVLDDLGFSPSEALEIKVKAELYRELMHYIKNRGLSQHELATMLGIHQPDVSNLLNGKVSRFSVGKLIQFAGRMNLGARVKLTHPKAAGPSNVSTHRRSRKREAAAA